ncbi:selenocysteine-specific translation elongation factor [Granulicoccus sp. GXG6511]|uniref:selenocysteine-specific translation elongation factor n=1 Tax=Granulicoccus sp. GXG6511 TaxID=3381351 RepID=UPI003D7D639B
MKVVATAGHVDHGKSTLVRALTGTDPDRWAEEHARGLTIDLGYAHTTLPSGETVAFVDVPGHQRFIANMLAGLGPAPAVLFVVAADEGWRAQSTEHLAAIDALGVRRGLLVITRSDLADPAAALAEAREHLAGTVLEGCPSVSVSALTGAGLDNLRSALDLLCAQTPTPDPAGRARLWVDRSFTIRGSGTVVTGTLEAGSLRVGDKVWVGGREIGVRHLQSLGADVSEVSAVARVAVNLRGVGVNEVRRGAVVLTGPWHHTEVVDARVPADVELPDRFMVHVGTAALEARVRPLGSGEGAGARHIRLMWSGPLPLQVGDRLVLRDPGRKQVLAGAVVLDVDPPLLGRRGAAQRRATWLAAAPERIDLVREVERRGFVAATTLERLGADLSASRGVQRRGLWFIAPAQWDAWRETLGSVVTEHVQRNPLQGRMSMQAATEAVGLPLDIAILEPLAKDAGLTLRGGYFVPRGALPDLGRAEQGLRRLEERLAQQPFRAPERDELVALALGVPEIAAAVRLARLIDLGDQIVLLPKAPAMAMRELVRLPQPFTTSQARQALDTTRRVVIPLLEHLDAKGWTRRLDGSLRVVSGK